MHFPGEDVLEEHCGFMVGMDLFIPQTPLIAGSCICSDRTTVKLEDSETLGSVHLHLREAREELLISLHV